ncbi:MAG: DNA replication/repair protein RecF [Candidatus Thiodiazotropha sp.]
MHIDYLSIENLRNIRSAELSPSRCLNILVGKNGAGKTTLLESIYLLARARSFRQQTRARLVNQDAQRLNLFARIETSDKTRHQIGLQQSANRIEIRKDGENLRKRSILAKTLPLTIITPNIQRVLEEDPENRRRLLNWGMFHVEHEYGDLANRYRKTLLQRNKALRGSTEQLKVWDRQIAELGTEIHQRMIGYTKLWNDTICEISETLQLDKPIKLELKTGWRDELTLYEAMEKNLERDKERGFTSCGPHRSDIKIMHNGIPAKNNFSRGEAKIAAVVMILSQTLMTKMNSGESPVMLVDDLHSELDAESYEMVLTLIANQKLQSFVTTLSLDSSLEISGAEESIVFHVEHGCVKGTNLC